MKKKIVHVIGIGDNGKDSLKGSLIDIIYRAEILFGGKRHLEFFTDFVAEKVIIDKKLSAAVEKLNKSTYKSAVVLVSGDPFFYGLGKYLVKNLQNVLLKFYPNLSSFQLAFAAIKMNWDDAHLVSLHSKKKETLLPVLKEKTKVALLTDNENTPAVIAQYIQKHFDSPFTCYVCENLGGKKEKITKGTLKKISSLEFSPLNVVILINNKKSLQENAPFSGIDDNNFHQRKPSSGLITKSEVRAVCLSKMQIEVNSTIWDIGSGSGSISIEAASFAHKGKVFSFEKNKKDWEIINKNIKKFGMNHCTAILGKAPETFKKLTEQPDIIFIGGSGGNMESILQTGIKRLKSGGRIVVNVITLENLQAAMTTLNSMKFSYSIVSLNISRSKPILNLTRFEPLTPVYILYGKK
ncbi:MAG: precorrin-6y C5,15-methyltransferase (decarboxylating) subunit CbiE [Nitrospinae bacterium]|nr:precorrin-6y C5,15-methyltransferase (decarboxylating) subunit CbiE [Nitrospinota bacterium]